MSKTLLFIMIHTEADGPVGTILCDGSGRPITKKYLCLDRLGNIIYTDGNPTIIEVPKPIKQFSRYFYSDKEKVRLIYPIDETEDLKVKNCKYIW